MRLTLTATLLLLVVTVAWPAEIVLQGDPPLPVPNLVANPGLEQGTGDAPTGWGFTTARPDNFETGWVGNGRSGKCLWVKAKTGVMSGYWNQVITVPPGKTILCTGFARLAAGKMLIYAHSSVRLPDGRSAAVDERFYRGTARGHWLVPVFLPPEALGGPPAEAWLPFRLKAKIPEAMQAIALSLGLYFQAGEAWFDDLWAGLAETDLSVSVKAAPGETLQRVTVTRTGSDKPVFSSPASQAGATTFATVLKAQPTDAVYTATVTLGDGKTVQQSYPAGEAK
jgi:hypothetical protein